MSVVGGLGGDYASAKTSVWWDIENCPVPNGRDPNAIAKNITTSLANFNYLGPVSISAYADTTLIPPSVQHALSSTGISLNHLPAGGEDKKILVDMLFWAVDNPAPANYLLISGDRDFSNALHQLRMRRYNILLAQPFQASPSLVAAASTVWSWTSLSAGGEPLPRVDATSITTAAKCFDNSKGLNCARQPGLSRAFSAPVGVLDSKRSDESCIKPKCGQFKKAPHEFFQSTNPPAAISTPGADGYVADKCNASQQSDNVLLSDTPYSHGNRMNAADFGKLNISGYPGSLQTNVDYYPKARPSEFHKPAALHPTYRGHVRPGFQPNYRRPRAPPPLSVQTVSNDGLWRNQSYTPTLGYVLHVHIILNALQTLKIERIMPTEANITDCIRFSDPRDFSTDVRKALDTAIEQNVVVKQRLGAVELYVGRNDILWNCVNPIGGNPNQYSNEIWDDIQQFLTSSYGRSAILASNCRYEAALVLRNECLGSFALGDVLQILNMILHLKKWIIHHQPGWQPLAITLKESN